MYLDKIKGGIYGLLVGDALGVPYEFHPAKDLPPDSEIEMTPPQTFKRSYPHITIGTWSDDGAQALALLDSLLSSKSLDPDDLMKRFILWYEKGTYAIDNLVFDIGIQTSEALRAYKQGTSALESGNIRPDGKGNGALMRVLPLALWHRGTNEQLVIDAHTQTQITHGHVCNQVCSALYCLWARYLLEDQNIEQSYLQAVQKLLSIYQSFPEHNYQLLEQVRPFDPPHTDGSGFVIASFHAARIALQESTYEKVVKKAISFGNDTDTNAAIAGGLAGIRDGVQNIPNRWMKLLRGKDMVDPLIKKLLMSIK